MAIIEKYSSPLLHDSDFDFGGRRLRYSLESRQQDRADAPAVVCVHGITRTRHDFRFLASRLERGFATYAPDLMGHGESEWLGEGLVYRKEMFLAQLSHLLGRIGQKRLGYVGTSYGGLLGILLAAEPDRRISCLVLNDTGPGLDPALFEKMAKMISYYPVFGSMTSAGVWVRAAMKQSGGASDEMFDHLLRHGVRQIGPDKFSLAYDPALPKLYTEQGQRPADIWDVWEKVKCPVLVVHGRHSQVLTTSMLERMKATMPGMEVFEVPDAGHFPHLMSVDQTRYVEDWLAAHLQAQL
jgi:pimeloyl-ACP methyl ester carboxylesterase